MSRYLPEKIRLLVAQRAGFRCEYCRVHQDDVYYPFEVDHILSIKHEGESNLENLALSCGICNRNKGSDIGTYLDGTRNFVRLFNPRIDSWFEHFDVDGEGSILAKTRIARATIKLLDFNNSDRAVLRSILMSMSRYP